MPQNRKISQRRLLLDQKRAQGFRSMPSTESRPRRPLIPVSPEKWTPCHWNRWSPWPGTGGRHPSESPVGMARIMQDAHFCVVVKEEIRDGRVSLIQYRDTPSHREQFVVFAHRFPPPLSRVFDPDWLNVSRGTITKN